MYLTSFGSNLALVGFYLIQMVHLQMPFAAVDGLGGVFPLYLDCFEFDFKVQLGANTNNHVDVYISLGWKSLVELDLSFNYLWIEWIPALPSQWTTSSILLEQKF